MAVAAALVLSALLLLGLRRHRALTVNGPDGGAGRLVGLEPGDAPTTASMALPSTLATAPTVPPMGTHATALAVPTAVLEATMARPPPTAPAGMAVLAPPSRVDTESGVAPSTLAAPTAVLQPSAGPSDPMAPTSTPQGPEASASLAALVAPTAVLPSNAAPTAPRTPEPSGAPTAPGGGSGPSAAPPKAAGAPPAPTLDPALAPVRAAVQAQLAVLEARYPVAVLARFADMGRGVPAALGARLTAAASPNGTTFVVGITGGSSTADMLGWATLLQRWRNETLGPLGGRAVVRNAAQGSTSQLVTAPCIATLVGTGDVDLLLWEFAMNDEFSFIDLDRPPDYPMRQRVAEVYLRQAIALNPVALGFVHLWDLTVHNYNAGAAVPNRAWRPTQALVHAYEAVYDRYLAFDTVGAMWAMDLYKTKGELLMDAHHPSRATHRVVADFLAFTILTAWAVYLDPSFVPSLPLPAPAQLPAVQLVDFPVRASPGSAKVLPAQHLFGHCLMASQPQLGMHPAILQVLEQANRTCGPAGTCTPVVNVGESSPIRADRQMRFQVPPCDASGQSGGLVFRITVANSLAYILLDCGGGRGCLDLLVVYLNGSLAAPNVDVTGDIFSYFYAWVHRIVPGTEPAPATQRLRVCSKPAEGTRALARVIALEDTRPAVASPTDGALFY